MTLNSYLSWVQGHGFFYCKNISKTIKTQGCVDIITFGSELTILLSKRWRVDNIVVRLMSSWQRGLYIYNLFDCD